MDVGGTPRAKIITGFVEQHIVCLTLTVQPLSWGNTLFPLDNWLSVTYTHWEERILGLIDYNTSICIDEGVFGKNHVMYFYLKNWLITRSISCRNCHSY